MPSVPARPPHPQARAGPRCDGLVRIGDAHDTFAGEVIHLAEQRGREPVRDMAGHLLVEDDRLLAERIVEILHA